MAGEHDTLNKPDQELLRSMLADLEAYRSGRAPFPGLVSALDVRINALVKREPALVEALREEWRILEEINALALDQGKLNPLEDDIAAAQAAIRDFEAAIKAQLAVISQGGGS